MSKLLEQDGVWGVIDDGQFIALNIQFAETQPVVATQSAQIEEPNYAQLSLRTLEQVVEESKSKDNL